MGTSYGWEFPYIHHTNPQKVLWLIDEPMQMKALTVLLKYLHQCFGKKMWRHAINFTKQKKWPQFKIVADPSAAKYFYLPQGCITIGEVASVISSERKIPVLQFQIS